MNEKKPKQYYLNIFVLLIGLVGWFSWIYVFWYILFVPSNRYYLNPFTFHEFWVEFIVIHIIVVSMIYSLIKILKVY